MNITDVRVRKVKSDGKMKAIVSVTFDDCFVVHDIKIIDGNNGQFVAMPSRKVADGDFRDIAHPIKSETRTQLQQEIFKAYEACKDDEGEDYPQETLNVIDQTEEMDPSEGIF